MKVVRKSPISGSINEMDLDISPEQMERWENGEYIQTAMGHLSAGEREFVMTGITPEEWDDMFGEDE